LDRNGEGVLLTREAGYLKGQLRALHSLLVGLTVCAALEISGRNNGRLRHSPCVGYMIRIEYSRVELT
jgi:hypothetical protein